MKDPNSFPLPPGFLFQPTDEDLLKHYLRNRHLSPPSPPFLQNSIPDFDIYSHDLKNLPDAACFPSADDKKRWYFFTPRVKGKLAGAVKRKARGGYWKKKGPDRPVVSGKGGGVLGTRKQFVFYRAAFPRVCKTGWVMLEYELSDSEFSQTKDSFALCRLFCKMHITAEKQVPDSHDENISAAANNDDVHIPFIRNEKHDKLNRFPMTLPDEHDVILAGLIDNESLPMEKFSIGSASDGIQDVKLFETAIIEGDFIELNDLSSPLPDVPSGRDENGL